ncbi:hypothetical protein TCAL_15357 [Tigriopus californicus]|uniref:Uncharacterized protein n=1 Tax=Tigriopus californicus TaxID=6832 RepID=A0A553PKX1_TIGCA|nr:hypothetical protein TCAL_15357 [Tigriopus californicus]
MEVDDDEVEYKVDCHVIGHCFGAVFISFHNENNEPQAAMVRSHRLFLNGRRVRPSEIKTVDKLGNVLREHFGRGVPVFAKVRNINRDGANYRTEDNQEVRPTWYSHCVWIGAEPSEDEQKAKGPKSISHASLEKDSRRSSVEYRSIPNNVTLATPGANTLSPPQERVFVEADFPILASNGPKTQAKKKEVFGVEGELLYQNPAGLGFLQFSYPVEDQGVQQLTAIFNGKVMLLDGEPLDPCHMKTWSKAIQDQKKKVYFNAYEDSQLYPHKRVERFQGDKEQPSMVIYKPTWRCTAVWVGDQPSEETLARLALYVENTSSKSKRKKMSVEEKEKIKDCEYFGGRLTTIVDKSTGVVQQKDKAVLFKIQDLWINGQQMSGEDKLSNLISLGEILFCYMRPLIPAKRIGDILCDRVAVQIWRGKRSKSRSNNNSECSHHENDTAAPLTNVATEPPKSRNDMAVAPTELMNRKDEDEDEDEDDVKSMEFESPHDHPENDRATFAMPSTATDLNCIGRVKELDGGLGLITIESGDAKNGENALFSRYRTYIEGHRLKYYDFLKDHIAVGDYLGVDLIKADPSKAAGEYQWLALLAWKSATKPDPELVRSDVEKKCDFYRARVIQLDKCPVRGSVSGVLHVIRGPNSVGERAIFKREHTYVFGARMAKADLSYVIKEKDKIQLEMERLDEEDAVEAKKKYGCEIKYCATLAWVGPTPKLERNCDTFPHYIGNSIYPFLNKRGMDEEFFTRLITGDLPPKKDPLSESAIDVSISLNPNEIWGRLVELKKPDAPKTGTEHGIIMIENGPFSSERAFFNRNSLWCWGQNMTKADLMHVIKESDRFNIEVRHGTNNKSVPFQVSHAWVGPHPEDKQRVVSESDPDFQKWLASHDLDIAKFKACVDGKLEVKPYFPLPLEQQCARIVHFYPSKRNLKGQGTEAGILKVHQGSLMKKDVLFERDSYIFREGDKVFCEATEISGREKKKWQAKLGIQSIPKYMATIVFVGGGRPKSNNPKLCDMDELESNTNLMQWLKKRNVEMDLFKKLLDGNLCPHEAAQAPPNQANAMHTHDACSSCGSWPASSSASAPKVPFAGVFTSAADTSHRFDFIPDFEPTRAPPPPLPAKAVPMENPLMSQAEDLIHKVLSCTSTNDENARNLIQNARELAIAEFICKTLGTAVQSYRQKNETANATPLHHRNGPPPDIRHGPPPPGPIAPPPRISVGASASNLPLNGGGLYGLQQPLLEFNGDHHWVTNESAPRTNRLLRQESPSDHAFSSPPEPPYKRKTHPWPS